MASRGTSVLAASRPTTAPPADTPAVQLSGVTRVFGVVPGIVRVDLAIERGEVVVLRGPNGAGKTTLLRVVATALSPTYGGGSVLGYDLVRGRDEIRRRIELLGHRTRLYEDLTAMENLRFACAMHGASDAGVPDALERVGLAAVARERVRGFSQGMRQRLAVARTLLRRPEVLLLDEPYAGLDPEAREVVDGTLEQARSEARTVVVATHDATRLRAGARTIWMDEGRVVPGRAAGEAAR